MKNFLVVLLIFPAIVAMVNKCPLTVWSADSPGHTKFRPDPSPGLSLVLNRSWELIHEKNAIWYARENKEGLIRTSLKMQKFNNERKHGRGLGRTYASKENYRSLLGFDPVFRHALERRLLRPVIQMGLYPNVNENQFSRCPSGYFMVARNKEGSEKKVFEGKVVFAQGCLKHWIGDFQYDTRTKELLMKIDDELGFVAFEEWREYRLAVG